MRALVWDGPWDLQVRNVDDATAGPGQALLRVIATGICGSDLHGYTGKNERRVPGQIMGHETVCRVEEAAWGTDLAPGELCTVNPVVACGQCPACQDGAEQSCRYRSVIGVTPDTRAAFAELVSVPARNVVRLPETTPVEYGALVEPLAVGYHAARRGECAPSDHVLVIGGGPIGQAAGLAARRLGVSRVLVSEPVAGRRALCAKLGLPVIDPGTLQDPEFSAEVEASLGGPATLVLDAVGSSRTVAQAISASAFGARIVLIGMSSVRLEVPAYSVSTEERSLIGTFAFTAREFADTAAWVGAAPPELAHLVDGRVHLDGAPATFHNMAKGHLDASKVLVYLAERPVDDPA